MTLWSRRRRRALRTDSRRHGPQTRTAHRDRVALRLAVIEAFRTGFIKQRCTVRFFDDFTALTAREP